MQNKEPFEILVVMNVMFIYVLMLGFEINKIAILFVALIDLIWIATSLRKNKHL